METVKCKHCGSDCKNGKNHIAKVLATDGENPNAVGANIFQIPANHGTLFFHNPETAYQCINPKCERAFVLKEGSKDHFVVALNCTVTLLGQKIKTKQ